MALTTDLSGLGTPPALAGRIGHPPSGNLVGVGTALIGGQRIVTTTVIGVPVTGQTAYVLPTVASGPAVWKEYYFYNNAATAVTALVYPSGDGSTLNGSASAALSIPQNKSAIFICYATAAGGGSWFSNLTG